MINIWYYAAFTLLLAMPIALPVSLITPDTYKGRVTAIAMSAIIVQVLALVWPYINVEIPMVLPW